MLQNDLKEEVRKKYSAIAKANGDESCCGEISCCGDGQLSVIMEEDYSEVNGYQNEADLSLGCGIPTEIANIQPGDTVLDLGAGAGNDAFIARKIVGDEGRVIGVDFTQEMVDLALKNNQKLGFQNVEFHTNEIEKMEAVDDQIVDVVISNCVMNLVPNKEAAFTEVYRVLKESGHFSISDIVHHGDIPEPILQAAEMYAGCVSGASEKGKYLGIIKDAGFKNIQIKKERRIVVPDEVLAKYMTSNEITAYRNSNAGIYSITVYAEKAEDGSCCSPEGGCC